jgi:hypothetical protein
MHVLDAGGVVASQMPPPLSQDSEDVDEDGNLLDEYADKDMLAIEDGGVASDKDTMDDENDGVPDDDEDEGPDDENDEDDMDDMEVNEDKPKVLLHVVSVVEHALSRLNQGRREVLSSDEESDDNDDKEDVDMNSKRADADRDLFADEGEGSSGRDYSDPE